MKEIAYIFQNLDTEGFLRTLDENSGEQVDPGDLVSENVKDCNEKILRYVNYLIIKGIFFQKIKNFSLIYHGYINFKNEDYAVSISCFYSETDNKYRLLFYAYEEKHFFEIKTYEKKPSIQKIEDDLLRFTDKNNDKNLEIYNYEGSLLGLNDEEKEEFKNEINLES